MISMPSSSVLAWIRLKTGPKISVLESALEEGTPSRMVGFRKFPECEELPVRPSRSTFAPSSAPLAINPSDCAAQTSHAPNSACPDSLGFSASLPGAFSLHRSSAIPCGTPAQHSANIGRLRPAEGASPVDPEFWADLLRNMINVWAFGLIAF